MVSNATFARGEPDWVNTWIKERGYFYGASIRLSVNLDKAATRATLIVVNGDSKEVAT